MCMLNFNIRREFHGMHFERIKKISEFYPSKYKSLVFSMELIWYAGGNSCPRFLSLTFHRKYMNFHQNRSAFFCHRKRPKFILLPTQKWSHWTVKVCVAWIGFSCILNRSKCKVIVTFRFFGAMSKPTKLKTSFAKQYISSIVV